MMTREEKIRVAIYIVVALAVVLAAIGVLVLLGYSFWIGGFTEKNPPSVFGTLEEWRSAWLAWGIIYYVGGGLVIALPALIAADLTGDGTSRKALAATSAIVAGLVTFIQPGTRATQHDQAYRCLKTAIVTGPGPVTSEQYKACADRLRYTYESPHPDPQQSEK